MPRSKASRPPAPARTPREPSKEAYHLMEAFEGLQPESASETLAEFLELVERQASDRSERLLEQAAAMDRIRAVASRRK